MFLYDFSRKQKMDKEKILETIKHAKQDIDNMLENAKLISEGIGLQFESIPRSTKECRFGKWFFSEGQRLKTLSNNPMECLQNIELLHEEFHEVYFEIVDLYEKSTPKGGLFKMFSKKPELPKEELHTLLQRLEHSHEKLSIELLKMQRRIQATPQEKLDALTAA